MWVRQGGGESGGKELSATAGLPSCVQSNLEYVHQRSIQNLPWRVITVEGISNAKDSSTD